MQKIILGLIFISSTAYGQDEQLVMKPIHTLFNAMTTGDTAAIRGAFHPEAILFTVTKDAKSGEPALRKETLIQFLTSVGKPHKEVYHELIWNEKVLIDGDFAQVWTDYGFYLNTTFNHCGVDAFQLIRNAKGAWLIYGLSDTRRKTGCDVPKEVEARIK